MFCRSKKGRLYGDEGEEIDRAEDSFHSLANISCFKQDILNGFYLREYTIKSVVFS
jgi:hypothetical protein